MGEREIRDKFGGKLDKALNRAIRAEVTGGNEALDKLTLLAGAARHSGWTTPDGKETAEAAAYFKHQKDVLGRMEAEVRRRWGVPRNAGEKRRIDPAGKKRQAGSRSGVKQVRRTKN